MRLLVIGGTRFFGIHMVKELLANGHEVTIATRGKADDDFGDCINRIIIERIDAESIRNALGGKHYDVVVDKIAYCSEDIKHVCDVIDCDKYIAMSSTAVYEPKHIDTKEEEFDGKTPTLIWCSRLEFPYEEGKRQAESAISQQYDHLNWIAVRYPFVLGEDDYTERLLFYVEHIMKSEPMNIDNIDVQMGFIRSDEAGKFMALLVEKDYRGPINGSAHGTISLKEIIDYVENKTGMKAVIAWDGEDAPYNGEPEYSINTDKAEELGFQFTNVRDWIYDLLDYYIELVKANEHN